MFVCPAICWLVSQLYFSPGDCSHACDGGLAEQPLVLFELPVPLVRPDARLRCCQVPVPTADYVSGFEMGLVPRKICMNVILKILSKLI